MKSKEDVLRDVEEKRLVAEEALKNAGEIWSGKNAVADVWRSTKSRYLQAQDKVVVAAQTTDQTIRANIYTSLGLAVGLGVIAGYLATRAPRRRKRSRRR